MNFEQINDTGCIADSIENNDIIPIGGSFVGKFDLNVCVDSNKFESFFKETETKAKEMEQNQAFGKWKEDLGAGDISTKAFAHLFVLSGMIKKIYPNASDNFNTHRKDFYTPENLKNLSEAFDNNVCACVEYSLLSQAYLQRQGIESQYMGGELLHDKNQEFGEAHSYLKIKEGDNEFLFDPANPITVNNSTMILPKICKPQISTAQKNQFESKIRSPQGRPCAFLEAQDLISKKTWYYGFGDGMNVFDSMIFSKNNQNNTLTQQKEL